LSDEAKVTVVDPPKRQQKKKTNSFPDFELIKVAGPDDPNWPNISEESTEVANHASRATLSEGTLYIYYSALFPKFEQESRRWAGLDIHKAASFERRYEVWLAVHALLLQEQEETDDERNGSEEAAEEFHRQERCRAAVLAAMVANQEVKAGDLGGEDADI
jgi:hypothetical protein